jgi:alkylation response protein AidB-like acyl-CoA dehydrogenase
MAGVERECRDDTARALFELTAEIADKELRPAAAAAERDGRFPRDEFRLLGRSGLLGLPYAEALGGAGQPYETYLQVVEELAGAWLTIGLGLSVHALSCFALATAGTAEQQQRWLPAMLGGDLLGAYCLSEPGSGSDAGAMRTSAQADGEEFVLNGTKAWITHAGVADFYAVFARTSGDPQARDRASGISCFHVPASTPGVRPGHPERKMGMRGSTTAPVIFDAATVPAGQLVGERGKGFSIALAALDAGRLGIAACATGLAQAALDAAIGWAGQRQQFGRPVIEFQGLSFMLADMATSVAAARALYLAAARRKDAGLPYGQQAAMAKLFASDAAMKVTTDAVQVLGGYGYVEDFPAERYLREAKALQIVEGTNQIQRMVIGRALARGLPAGGSGGPSPQAGTAGGSGGPSPRAGTAGSGE